MSAAPRLFTATPLEVKDDHELRLEKCYKLVTSITQDKGDKEGNEALAAAVSRSDKAHEEICIGLIVGILGEPELAAKHFRDLNLVARDGLAIACNHLTSLVLDKYPKMMPATRQQLLWLTREMIKSSVANMENICWNLMRQISGGDLSQPNLWLADNLLDIFIDHRAWLERFPFLLASVVYTYLRIIEDHVPPQLEALRQKEVHFVVSLMRERFAEVCVIGRDLLRVLQYVARIPEFEQLWMDIINNPKSLAPNFTGVTSLMHTRTSRRFLQSRITPEMEKKLIFLTSQVRFGTHKRYQDWFQKMYLSTNESQSLRCDLIRFIVGVIHPSNEILGSDIIPRWAIIGWLLTTCTNQVASSNAKLALFYDWLFFDPAKDNIMNIEPAILVMHHSMRPHPAITATLLDFLCRIITNFFPKEREKVHAGVTNSLKTILEKRVLPTLQPLFDNARLDEELRMMLRERFPQFVGKEGTDQDMTPLNQGQAAEEESEDTPRFSDDEDDDQSSTPTRKVSRKKQKSNRDNENHDDQEEVLDEEVLEVLQEMKTERKDLAKQCETMENLIRHACDKDYDFQQCSALAAQLAEILKDEFEGKIFPTDPNPDALDDSIGKPIFVAFRWLSESLDGDPRNVILTLLAELYALQPRIGYYLLYFLRSDRNTKRTPKEKANVYKDLCETIDEKYSLDICLVNDMRQCQEDDVNLFVHLLPEIFTNFPKQAIGNTDLLYLVVSCVDGRQIQSLVCNITAKDFLMFKKDSFSTVVNVSLTWETFEQCALWQLASAHDLPLECILPVIPRLSTSKHSEALTSILLLLRQERPTNEILKALLSRDIEAGDNFTSSILLHWQHDYEDKLSDLVSNYLCKQASLGSSKRKRNQPFKSGSGSSSAPHAADLCLHHLDKLRQTNKHTDFFYLDNMQQALQQARNSCTDAQKKKFVDLFALADSESEEEEEESSPKKKSMSKNSVSGSGGGSGGTKSPGKSKMSARNSGNNKRNALTDSSGDSSDNSEDNAKLSSRSKRGGGSGRGAASAASSKTQRKRNTNKVSSYKISSDDSSDDDADTKKPPKKKRAVASTHSDSD